MFNYFYDTTELRNMILDNPTLPLLVFVNEDVNSGDYSWTQANVKCEISDLALYNDELWVDYDDYEERLTNDLCDEEEYENMSDEEYEQMIKDKMDKVEFAKCIVMWVG